MMRRLAHIARLALVGSASTFATAWLLALVEMPERHSAFLSHDLEVLWQVNQRTGVGSTDTEWFPVASMPVAAAAEDAPFELRRRRRLSREPHVDASDRPRMSLEYARGWPARALWCEYVPDAARPGQWHGAISLRAPTTFPPTAQQLTALPFRPIWSSLVVDTAFYATLCGTLMFVGSGFRKAARRRRGACVGCGYDLRGGPRLCPECGRAR